MPSIDSLLHALDERTIAQLVGIPHDEARMSYPLRTNTVATWSEFEDTIGDYVNHHFTRCVSRGGSLSITEARGLAKEILEQAYRRNNGNITSAYNDGAEGVNGGMRHVLDILADGLKEQAVERYLRAAFDAHVAPNSWEDKLDLVRQFITYCGANLSSAIRRHQPERYAQDYRDLVRSYVDALRHTSHVFRRM